MGKVQPKTLQDEVSLHRIMNELAKLSWPRLLDSLLEAVEPLSREVDRAAHSCRGSVRGQEQEVNHVNRPLARRHQDDPAIQVRSRNGSKRARNECRKSGHHHWRQSMTNRNGSPSLKSESFDEEVHRPKVYAGLFARLRGDPRETSPAVPAGRSGTREGSAGRFDEGGTVVAPGDGGGNPLPVDWLIEQQGKAVADRLKDLKLPGVKEIEKLRPKMEALRESLPYVSLSELAEKVPQWRRGSQGFPDKQKLSSVQEFFRYTEAEGRKLFEELDGDGDGQVRVEDLEQAMRRRRLPVRYAREFLRRTRRHWLANSFGWEEFLSLMEQKEPSMLRAFNSLSVSASGTLQRSQVLASLRRAGLPATEDNARAMMQYLDADLERGQVAYGQFRNFLLLLPPERLERDPSMVWFEAATVVPMSPPVSVPAGSVLKSALAGGLASGLSTCVMHPLDTLKTRVQASPVSLSEVMGSLPKMGLVGLYRGSVPAIVGQFASHGLRTGVFEASKLLLHHLAPDLSELQVQPIASLCSTVLGTGLRIPCEVLKQRLQAGLYSNVGSAIQGTLRQEGPLGLFRGTTATLCREVPFYVAGLLIYQEAKKVVRHSLQRELAPWETLLVGGVSGGLAAVCTTPFDVIKTRMMIAQPGGPSGLVRTGLAIIASEGVLALYKGALPRFFWIAPLGAMNFAGYELAKQAMDEQETASEAQGAKVLVPV